MTTPLPGDGTDLPSGLSGSTPSSPDDVAALVREELRERREGGAGSTKKGGMVKVLVGLGLLVLGAAGVLIRAAVLHQHLGFWEYTWVTLPVGAAAGYIGYRIGLGRGLSFPHVGGLLVGTLGTSYLTGLTGGSAISNSLFGGLDINCLLQNQDPTKCTAAAATPQESPLHAAQRIVGNYWDLYGPAGIISALVVGLVFGIGLALVANRNARNA